jgi:hypothetical protein
MAKNAAAAKLDAAKLANGGGTLEDETHDILVESRPASSSSASASSAFTNDFLPYKAKPHDRKLSKVRVKHTARTMFLFFSLPRLRVAIYVLP